MERKHLYCIRHAQSTYNQAALEYENQNKKSQMHELKWNIEYMDAELSTYGELQALNAIPDVHALRVQTVFVSPFRRALRTAQILFENHPDHPNIIVHPLLAEKLKNVPDVSVWQGTPYSQFPNFDWSLMPNHYFLFDLVVNAHTAKLKTLPIDDIPRKLLEEMVSMIPEKIESAEDMYKRAQESKEVWKKSTLNGNVALVSHSNYFKFFTMKHDENGSHFRWLNNCEIYEYEDVEWNNDL